MKGMGRPTLPATTPLVEKILKKESLKAGKPMKPGANRSKTMHGEEGHMDTRSKRR
jgi:hypothetical protein